ncbi:hypothetical protein J3F84DRAFT_361726 [Trichoderma pleuroticola]
MGLGFLFLLVEVRFWRMTMLRVGRTVADGDGGACFGGGGHARRICYRRRVFLVDCLGDLGMKMNRDYQWI